MWFKNKIKKYLRRVTRVLMSETLTVESDKILRGVSRLQSIQALHQKTFDGYKGMYEGKSVVLIGAGPSVNKFRPIEDCVYVGLNRACLLKSVKYDYLFTIDKLGIDKIYPNFAEYDCVKFVGDQNLGSAFQIPESEIIKMKKVLRYKTDAGLFRESKFALDIDSEPLGNFNTVSLQAMQFILYTHPKKVYIVGIDCSAAGHFTSDQCGTKEHHERLESRGENTDAMVRGYLRYWYEFKDFADQYYPGTEIISVNPVGLRGLFKDLDQ